MDLARWYREDLNLYFEQDGRKIIVGGNGPGGQGFLTFREEYVSRHEYLDSYAEQKSPYILLILWEEWVELV